MRACTVKLTQISVILITMACSQSTLAATLQNVGASGHVNPSVSTNNSAYYAPVNVSASIVGTSTPGSTGNRGPNGDIDGQAVQQLPGDNCHDVDSGMRIQLGTPDGGIPITQTGTYYMSATVGSYNCNGGSGEWNIVFFFPQIWRNGSYLKNIDVCTIEVDHWGGGSCGFGGGQYYENNDFNNGSGSAANNCSMGTLLKGDEVFLMGQVRQSGTCGPCVRVTHGSVTIQSSS